MKNKEIHKSRCICFRLQISTGKNYRRAALSEKSKDDGIRNKNKQNYIEKKLRTL